MATFSRHVDVNWQGSIMEGKGGVKAGSGAFTLPVSFPQRIGESNGATSPEELIAAAHAACFSMALSAGLAKEGHPPDELKVSATVTFQPGEGITKIALAVDGTVPGIDADAFRAAAEGAKENCPVSKALASVPEITLEARLG
jgi:osmotically inducible protein OsmC